MTLGSIFFRTMAIAAMLVAAYVLPIALMSEQQLPSAFGQTTKEKPGAETSSSNPKENDTIASHSLYNVLSQQAIMELSKPENKTLQKSLTSDTGLGSTHKDDWIMTNHDIYYSRNSNQTTIGKGM
jgi:hypothetical protein